MVTGALPTHSSATGSRCAYGGGVADSPVEHPNRGAASIAVYTAMRLGLFVGVWLLLQLLTPLRGLWAVALAIIVSGLISLFLLNKQRAVMSSVVAGFFGRINSRIDAASQAEDDWDDQSRGDGHGVDDDQTSGTHERGNETGSSRTAGDDSNRA